MKRFRWPYWNKRTNRWINRIDYAFAILMFILMGVVCSVPSSFAGIREFLVNEFALSENGAEIMMGIGILVLMYLEPILTYYIDKRISK